MSPTTNVKKNLCMIPTGQIKKYLSNFLRCNIELNELFRQRNEIAEIAKRHTSESLMMRSLRHYVFSDKDLRPVLCLIFQFACTPGYALVSRYIVPWLPDAHEQSSSSRVVLSYTQCNLFPVVALCCKL